MMLLLSSLLFTSFLTLSTADTLVARPLDFKSNCQLSASGGCECRLAEGAQGEETTRHYDTLDPCRMSVELQTAKNKEKLNAEIQQKFGAFKDNCFPRPSGGCKCNVDEGNGEIVKDFTEDKDCKKSIEVETAEKKKKLNEEMKEKFGGFKENCFPKPSGGCKCNEKDNEGNEVVATYDDVNKCQATTSSRVRRQVRGSSPTPDGPNYNVRDPVREKAQANYAAVLDELRNKFKGLKEGCFPRPKGCLCITGKTPEGRDITERRMKDVDCKCQPGETGQGCPAA